MDLNTLWKLASGWYAGRMERGYKRREPEGASTYFEEVGLRGAFWRLPEQNDSVKGRELTGIHGTKMDREK
jgi:hypothetical protein